jgi:hypothetical protein
VSLFLPLYFKACLFYTMPTSQGVTIKTHPLNRVRSIMLDLGEGGGMI